MHYPFGMHPNAVPANMNNGGPPGPGEQRINGEGHYSQVNFKQIFNTVFFFLKIVFL